jgi:adhesin/invasin
VIVRSPMSPPRLRPLAAAALAALALSACVPTVRTPLKQALPAVLGAEAGDGLCLREVATTPLPGAPTDAALADFDRDGALDLALIAAGPSGAALVFAFNDGRGGLTRTTTLNLNGAPVALAAADLNLDGAADLVVASAPASSREPSALHVLLGDGAGGFIAGAAPLKREPGAVLLRDLDANGLPDAVVFSRDGREISSLIGDGRGELKLAHRHDLGDPTSPAKVVVDDLDNDRIPDLITLDERRGRALVNISLGKGDGSFKPKLRIEVGEGAAALAAADFNQDGALDLVALTTSGGEFSPPAAALLLGNGALGFLGVRYFGPPGAAELRLADLDGDGAADLISRRASGDGLAVILGDRRGGLTKVQETALGQRADLIRIGDLDRDGRPEVLTMSPSRASVTIVQGSPCASQR